MRFLRGVESRIRRLRRGLSPLIYAGSNVFCPVCDRSYRKFRAAGRGADRRLGAVCPKCTARERDRFMYLCLERLKPELARESLRLLHIAPEGSLGQSLHQLATGGRITADLVRTDVDVRLDLQALPFRDGSMDAIYCGHVLQQIPDDVAALREMRRVLNESGWLMLLTPSGGATTVDYTEPRERVRRALDAPDTIRRYGTDLDAKVRSLGFAVKKIECDEFLDPQDQERLAITPSRVGDVYLLKAAIG